MSNFFKGKEGKDLLKYLLFLFILFLVSFFLWKNTHNDFLTSVFVIVMFLGYIIYDTFKGMKPFL